MAPHLIMEYSATVGTMLIDKLASTTKRTKEGIGRLVLELEERVDFLDERFNKVMEGVSDAQGKAQDLHQHVLELEANNCKLEGRVGVLEQEWERQATVIKNQSDALDLIIAEVGWLGDMVASFQAFHMALQYGQVI